MTQADIQAIQDKVQPILKEAGVTRSSIFGSYVHGDFTEASDIDMLVDVPRGTSLFDLVDLQMKLTEVLGKEVDVVTFASLHPLLKDRILSEQVPIL